MAANVAASSPASDPCAPRCYAKPPRRPTGALCSSTCVCTAIRRLASGRVRAPPRFYRFQPIPQRSEAPQGPATLPGPARPACRGRPLGKITLRAVPQRPPRAHPGRETRFMADAKMTLGDLAKHVGEEVGVSSWTLLDQERIADFAAAPAITSGSTSTPSAPRVRVLRRHDRARLPDPVADRAHDLRGHGLARRGQVRRQLRPR